MNLSDLIEPDTTSGAIDIMVTEHALLGQPKYIPGVSVFGITIRPKIVIHPDDWQPIEASLELSTNPLDKLFGCTVVRCP